MKVKEGEYVEGILQSNVKQTLTPMGKEGREVVRYFEGAEVKESKMILEG